METQGALRHPFQEKKLRFGFKYNIVKKALCEIKSPKLGEK